MGRRKPFWALLAAGVTAAASIAVMSASTPAGAFSSTCGTGATAPTNANQIGEFPAIQASQSSLHFACSFYNGASNEVASNFTFHDYQNAVWHNGGARKVTLAAAASGATTIVATSGVFLTTDVNHPISALGVTTTTNVIPARAFIKTRTDATHAVLNIPLSAAVPVGTVAKIDNSSARSVASGKTAASNASWTATTVTCSACNFTAADTNQSVAGTGIPDYKKITFVNATTATIQGGGATACTPSPTVDCTVTIGGSTNFPTSTRQVGDATNTATVITSASANFAASDIGLSVSLPTGVAPALPATLYVASVSGNTATVAGGTMTANAAAHIMVIGTPSVTAPTNGNAVADIGTILDLNPALVAGSNACTLNKPEGISLQGTWNNPGSFQTVADPGVALPFLGAAPASGKLIGQIVFRTSAVDFGAYVQESAAAGDAAKPVKHYDVVFPLVPTALGKCPSPNTVNVTSSFHIVGVAQSQSIVPAGTGKPSSAALRVLTGNNGVAAATTAVMQSNTAAPANWSFTNTCTMAAAPASSFNCGY
ncbi:MAG: hypothetical protein JWM05_3376 [Acidimicrobiales bacterium]|nr:hypothetical protein [Acidimicrobiales bacterium]